MAILLAEFVQNDADFPVEFRDEGGIISAAKRFKVNTDDVLQGRKAQGLPRGGDPLDAFDYPNVSCVSVEWEKGLGGTNTEWDANANCAVGAHSVWCARYRSETTGLGTYIFDGLLFTREEWGVETVTLYHGLREQDRGRRIKNGDGADVEVGALLYRVEKWGKLNDTAAWLDANRMRIAQLVRYQMVNNAEVMLPASLGSPRPIRCPAGTLRMHGFRPDHRGGLMGLEYTFKFAPIPTPGPGQPPSESGWFFAWQPEDFSGRAVGEPVDAQVYRTGDLSGLW